VDESASVGSPRTHLALSCPDATCTASIRSFDVPKTCRMSSTREKKLRNRPGHEFLDARKIREFSANSQETRGSKEPQLHSDERTLKSGS
jgi:hypothetical protein